MPATPKSSSKNAIAALSVRPVVVRLFGKEIFRAYTSPLNNRAIVGIQLKTGDFYDSKGRPSAQPASDSTACWTSYAPRATFPRAFVSSS